MTDAEHPCPQCRETLVWDNSTSSWRCLNCGHTSKPAGAGEQPEKESTSVLARVVLFLVALAFFGMLLQGLLTWAPDLEPAASSPPDDSTTAASASTSQVQLELVDWSWSSTAGGNFVEAQGQVKNISDEPLEDVQAVVTFMKEDGAFITSASALIEYDPLLPGQTSPWC